MLLEIPFSQQDCGDLTLFQTIQEVIGRINIGKWIDFHRQRQGCLWSDCVTHDYSVLAYARYGYASLRQRKRWATMICAAAGCFRDRRRPIKPISDSSTISWKRLIEELSHQVYLCIQDHKALEAAVLMIDGTKFEANANKMTFFWGA